MDWWEIYLKLYQSYQIKLRKQKENKKFSLEL
jgi:hypothetical protein